MSEAKIDFYNKGLTQASSPGLRSAGGLPGVGMNNEELGEGFQHYSHDQY
jgi:hypothetical protein